MPIHFDHTGAGVLTISAPTSGSATFDGSGLGGGGTSIVVREVVWDQCGFGCTINRGTVANLTALNALATPAAGDLATVTSTGTVWYYVDSDAVNGATLNKWFDSGLSAACITGPRCYSDGADVIKVVSGPKGAGNEWPSPNWLPVVILRGVNANHQEVTRVEIDRNIENNSDGLPTLFGAVTNPTALSQNQKDISFAVASANFTSSNYTKRRYAFFNDGVGTAYSIWFAARDGGVFEKNTNLNDTTDMDAWTCIGGSLQLLTAGIYSADGWGNDAQKAGNGFFERFSLNEEEYSNVDRVWNIDPLDTGYGSPTIPAATMDSATFATWQLVPANIVLNTWVQLTDDPTYNWWCNGYIWEPYLKSQYGKLPYVLGDHGENRLVCGKNSTGDNNDAGTAFIVCPLLSTDDPTLTSYHRDTYLQSLKRDFKFSIDASLSDDAWIICQQAASGQWRDNYPLPSFSGFGLKIRRKSHLDLEFYPDGVQGAWTAAKWGPVGTYGVLLRSMGHAEDGGFANPISQTRGGNYSRYSLTENQYKSLIWGLEGYDNGNCPGFIDVNAGTTPYTYTCQPGDANIVHRVHGVDDCDLTIKLPDTASANETWKFYFGHPISPKFTTIGGTNHVDGQLVCKPMARRATAETYIEFTQQGQLSGIAGWQSRNNTSLQERVYDLDVKTTGVLANNRGTFSTSHSQVSSPVNGDSCYITADSKYYYYNTSNLFKDGIVGWEDWGDQNPANPPYIAMSNGENRLNMFYNGTDPGKALGFIILPCIGSGDTAQENIAQYCTFDQEYFVDTSYRGGEGAVIFAGAWTYTDSEIHDDLRDIKKVYPSIPDYYTNRTSNSGSAIRLTANKHMILEPYPDGIYTDTPGTRTKINWNPTKGYGVLFSKARPRSADGWGTETELNQYGYACRYTMSEHEWNDVASKLYTDVFTDTTPYPWNSPLDIDALWGSLKSSNRNQAKNHLVIDPSAFGAGGATSTNPAYFRLPDPNSCYLDTRVTVKSNYSNGTQILKFFEATDSWTGSSSDYNFPTDPNLGLKICSVKNTKSTSITFRVTSNDTNTLLPSNFWTIECTGDFTGLERNGWGNAPDWAASGANNGVPVRFTLTEKEYLNIPNIPENVALVDSNSDIVWASDFDLNLHQFKVLHIDLDTGSNRTLKIGGAPLNNGTYVYIFNHDINTVGRTLTLDPTSAGLYPTFKINGASSLVMPPNSWVQLICASDAATDYKVIAASQPSLIGAEKALGNPGSNGQLLASTTSGTRSWVAPGEPALGNPSINGYILSSTTTGTRSWIAPPSGGASRNVDGGNPTSVYLPSQNINGGTP